MQYRCNAKSISCYAGLLSRLQPILHFDRNTTGTTINPVTRPCQRGIFFLLPICHDTCDICDVDGPHACNISYSLPRHRHQLHRSRYLWNARRFHYPQSQDPAKAYRLSLFQWRHKKLRRQFQGMNKGGSGLTEEIASVTSISYQ